MDSTTNNVSSRLHARGCTRRTRYSQGRTDSAASPAFTPAVYASSTCNSAASKRASIPAARYRNRCLRISVSSGSAAGPNNSASSPADCRRSRSIWKNRSWACRNPSARAASSRLPAWTVGTPFASRSTLTSAPNPPRCLLPSSTGRLLRNASHPAAGTLTATTTMAISSHRNQRPLRNGSLMFKEGSRTGS